MLRRVFAIIFLFASTAATAQEYRITDFGAVGDGQTLNTAAIQKAIDACAIGGGKVIIPEGNFLSGTIELKSGVTLHLAKKALLLGSGKVSDYPVLDAGMDFYGHDWAKQALIFAKGLKNVSIEGEGTIDGQGAEFKITTNTKPDRYRNRPYLLWFVQCRNVQVEKITLRNSAFWMQHYLGCDGVRISGINIWNHSNRNNDMIDIDGCKNVLIEKVTGDSDDDGITLKSTSRLITENVNVADCVLSSHCNAIKLGTESTGGFRNITISNCRIRKSGQRRTIYGVPDGNSGVSLEMVDGGVMENIEVSEIKCDGPQVPLFIRLGNRARKYTDSAAAPPVGIMRNITVRNFIATGADTTGCSITGIPGHPIENVTLSNISIETSGGGLGNPLKKVDELESQYPEGIMFGQLPAYGIYLRHVNNVKLINVVLQYFKPEYRSGIFFDDVQKFEIISGRIQTDTKSFAAIIGTSENQGSISNINHVDPVRSFLVTTLESKISLLKVEAPKARRLVSKIIYD